MHCAMSLTRESYYFLLHSITSSTKKCNGRVQALQAPPPAHINTKRTSTQSAQYIHVMWKRVSAGGTAAALSTAILLLFAARAQASGTCRAGPPCRQPRSPRCLRSPSPPSSVLGRLLPALGRRVLRRGLRPALGRGRVASRRAAIGHARLRRWGGVSAIALRLGGREKKVVRPCWGCASGAILFANAGCGSCSRGPSPGPGS